MELNVLLSKLHIKFVSLIRFACNFLYSVLPADLCTRLACSRFGNLVGSWIAPAGNSVYHCDFGIKLWLPRGDAVFLGFAHMGRTNPLETDLVLKYLKPGDTLVQIGAFKEGWLSLVGSMVVGPKGSVRCFEPIPEYVAFLRKNIQLNNRENVVVEQMAISDTRGTTLCSVASVSSTIMLVGNQESVRVETISLDEYVFVHGVSAVDFLIIDAEGAEPLILKGAQKTLASSVSFLLMEVCDEHLRQSGTTAQKLVQMVTAMGFHAYIITRKGLRPWDIGRVSETANMFFSKRDMMMDEQAGAGGK